MTALETGSLATTTIIWCIRITLVAGLLWLVIHTIVGGYRYYRDHKPNRRVGLPQPHYDERSSIERFNRNVGRG